MRPAPRSSLPGLILVAAVAAQAAPSTKETATRQQLEAAQQARAAQLAAQKQAAARAAEATEREQRLAAERVAAAARLRDAELATAAAASRMEELAARKREADARLDARLAAMRPFFPVIERLALYPAETLLAVPVPPEDAVRGLIVLKGLSRQLADEARALRHDREELEAATRAMQAEAPKLASAQKAQAEQAAALDRQIAAARSDQRLANSDADAAVQRAAAEAARADTLRSVLSTLETQRKAAEAAAREEAARAERQKREGEAAAARERAAALAKAGSMASNARAHGQLTAPVAGHIVRAWGDATEAGPATGVSYQASPSARVVAPCAGRVVFADAFRSYGELLILDCGGGYHAVLAGFERLDVTVGRSVQSGEPVGTMPGWDPAGTGRRPLLYVELRHDGQPVNPAPWLKSSS